MARIKHAEFRRWLQAIESGRPISIKCGNLHFRRDGWIFSYQQWIGHVITVGPINAVYVNHTVQGRSRTTNSHLRALEPHAMPVGWRRMSETVTVGLMPHLSFNATRVLLATRAPSERWVYAANLDVPDW